GPRRLHLARRADASGGPHRPHVAERAGRRTNMALFTYKAIDTRGKTMLGQIEAVNLGDLEQRLKRMGLDLVRGGPSRSGGAWLRVGTVKRSELINFCFHMEQLTAAGVPLVESLIDLRDSIDNARFREVISGVIESIQGGLRLSQ